MTAVRRTPLVPQSDAVECGAACLCSILAYHGRHVPLDQLRDECGVTRDGSNAAGIAAAARRHGLSAVGYRMSAAELDELPGPSILFWEGNHFVVYEGRAGERVWINDPAVGRRRLDRAEFDPSFSGVVIWCEPGPDFEPTPDLAPPSPPRVLLIHARQHRVEMVYAACGGVLAALPTIAAAAVVRWLFDFRTDQAGRIAAAAVIVAAVAWRAVVMVLLRNVAVRSALKTSVVAGGGLWWRILRLPLTYFQHRSRADAAARVQARTDAAWAFCDAALPAVAVGVGALIIMAVLAAVWPAMGLAALLVTAAAGVAAFASDRSGGQDDARHRTESVRAWGEALSLVNRLDAVKACAREAEAWSRVVGADARSETAAQRGAARRAAAAGLEAAVPFLCTAVVAGVGAAALFQHAISVGAFAAGMVLATGVGSAVAAFAPLPALASTLAAEHRRSRDTERRPPDPLLADDNPAITVTAATRRLKGFVELRNVTFGFSRQADPLLRDVSLSAAPGEFLALVGPSGSGKSTLARLIAGLHEPWDGQILLDGATRDRLPRSLLANSIAMVDQDFWLFAGTVRENITLWDPTIPDDAAQRAAKDAAIHDRITRRRGGYAADVLDAGRNFSGGQRQRLAIARALALDPTVLILDEATSALDAPAERQILDAIRRRGCTCILVAHRLSAVRECHRIVVLDQGAVVQQGHHDDLLRQQGPYADLMRDAEAPVA